MSQQDQILAELARISAGLLENRESIDQLNERRQRSKEEQDRQDKKDSRDLLIKAGALLFSAIAVCFTMLELVGRAEEKDKEAFLNEIKLLYKSETQGQSDRILSLEHDVDRNHQAIGELKTKWESFAR